MSTPNSPSPVTTARRVRKRPFLLTSAWARIAIALSVSLGLWVMTGWAMGWSLS